MCILNTNCRSFFCLLYCIYLVNIISKGRYLVTVIDVCVSSLLILNPDQCFSLHSCFTSDRINLSPFTKDFRGEEHNEYKLIFDALP